MKLISVSSLLYYVKDLAKTQEFYESAGFHFDKDKDKVITYLNWFSIEFREAKGPTDNNSGEYVYIKVNDVDEISKRLKSKGILPEGEPKDVGGGIKELQICDPDGYRLTFFQKK
jgi:predicted enzyme related to lactoylglutathione lyase